MKSLQESLFDKDLVQKDIGTLSVIVAYIENFLTGKTTKIKWIKCLDDISKAIKYVPKDGYDLLGRSIPNKITDGELYVSIDTGTTNPSLLLMARGLIGDREFSTEACPLTIIKYDDNINSIYIDVYRTGVDTVDYKRNIHLYKGKFQWYKLSKEDVEIYINNIFTRIDQVF